jgi:hypothetical protein
VAYRRRSAGPQESLERRWRACSVTMDFSVVDPQRMMCTYGPAEGVLLNHSYMHGVCGSISSQYAVTHRSGGALVVPQAESKTT